MTNEAERLCYTETTGGEIIYQIYIDKVFLLNFWMNFCILIIVSAFLKCSVTHHKIVKGALLGSLSLCLLLMLPFAVHIKYFLGILCSVAIQNYYVFKPGTKKLMLQLCFVFLMVYILTGGSIALTERLFFMPKRSFWSVFGISSVITFVSCAVFRAVNKNRDSVFCEVILQNDTVQMKLKALIDSGNGLYDPISKKAVSIISEHSLPKEFIKREERIAAIPFHAVGTENGIMQGYIFDSMIITAKTHSIMIKRPMIGIIQGEISGEKKYQMILHPDLLKEREEMI